MAKYTINESKLREIVEESVRTYLMEDGMEEGFFSNLGAGFRNAFGGDVNKMKGAAQAMGDKIKSGANTAWNGVKKAGEAVADKATSAYNNVAQGVEQRVDAFKDNYEAQKKASAAMDAAKSGEKQANKAIATLDKLREKGVITSKGAIQALEKLKQCLQMQSMNRYKTANKAQAKVK